MKAQAQRHLRIYDLGDTVVGHCNCFLLLQNTSPQTSQPDTPTSVMSPSAGPQVRAPVSCILCADASARCGLGLQSRLRLRLHFQVIQGVRRIQFLSSPQLSFPYLCRLPAGGPLPEATLGSSTPGPLPKTASSRISSGCHHWVSYM